MQETCCCRILHDEALFKEHPPTDDCHIYFLPLPHDRGQITYHSCCCKQLICRDCIYAMDEEACGRGKVDLCAFCRNLGSTSDEDEVKRMKKLMVAENARAFYNLAGWHATGDFPNQ